MMISKYMERLEELSNSLEYFDLEPNEQALFISSLSEFTDTELENIFDELNIEY